AIGLGHNTGIQHVLLISIDGFHALDYINCSQGLSTVNGGAPYCPNLASLGLTGVNYETASTSKPSDSFPGLMTLMTGGTPRTMGIYYDVAYDRVYAPPLDTTGNGLAGGSCITNTPNGTSTEYEEGIDIDQTKLNGGAPAGVDGGIESINQNFLIRDPYNNCNPVYPWNFVRDNTIFGVVHAAHGYTAWSDKHPAYSAVSGPGNGTNVDDYYSPEINSTVIPLNVTTPGGLNCNPIPDSTADLSAYTNSFQNIQCYDTLKVNAIINEIDGKTHNGSSGAPVPAIFGMNFQAVSVGQKLIEKTLTPTVVGGYDTSVAANAVYGTPTSALVGEIEFVDASIGEFITELQKKHLADSTLIIITAKHGQSPIDSNRYLRIPADLAGGKSPATILDDAGGYLPASEAPSGGQIGPTEDDISLLWLLPTASVTDAVNLLETASPARPPSDNIAGIGQIFAGPAVPLIYDTPGLPPNDPRTPDIVITPNVGVIYTGSTKKLSEHGGFAHDDTNVILLVSNPLFKPATITLPVETRQVAPTILRALGLNPASLDAVQVEGTEVLPGLSFGIY
ncbi:MAG: alkaline phosphatase family protein, partial [Candidatus Binataceae bacterium]